jgi:hypothetical protein
MSGGIGLERSAIAGAVATGIGLVAVALRPPTALSPVALLGTLALGAGLGVVALAGFDFVASRIVATDAGPGVGNGGDSNANDRAPDDRSSEAGIPGVRDPEAGGSDTARAGPDARNGGLAATEEFLRGGTARGPTRGEAGRREELEPADMDDDVEADDEGFIWGEDRERDDA